MAINLNINLKTINGESITGTGNLVVNSINWRGELTNAPGTPIDYDAYHNLTDGNTYLYFDGRWQVFSAKGDKGDEGEGLTELEIGTPITSSTAKSILFVDGSGKLGEITNFQYDEVADSLTFMHNDIGLLLNSETEVDDGVFTNLNGIAKMVDGAPEVFVGIADLSILDPLWGEGVYIASDNEILIDSISKMVFNSDSEIKLISDDVALGGDNSFITVNENIMFTNEGGEFKFYHKADPVFGDYMIKLFKQDDTLIDGTAYSAGSGIDTATWDGYTIGQLFQAMKNMGFLA